MGLGLMGGGPRVDCCAVACSDFREFAATVDSGPHTFYIICFYIRALSLLP